MNKNYSNSFAMTLNLTTAHKCTLSRRQFDFKVMFTIRSVPSMSNTLHIQSYTNSSYRNIFTAAVALLPILFVSKPATSVPVRVRHLFRRRAVPFSVLLFLYGSPHHDPSAHHDLSAHHDPSAAAFLFRILLCQVLPFLFP